MVDDRFPPRATTVGIAKIKIAAELGGEHQAIAPCRVATEMIASGSALDDLVRAGKVRYIGVSDTPAWKVVEANITARFRGWSQFIGLQIEYSLLERSVEAELVPMAHELGLGIMPWSPLKSGALSGKYTRATADTHKTDRGDHDRAHPTNKNHVGEVKCGGGSFSKTSAYPQIASAWQNSCFAILRKITYAVLPAALTQSTMARNRHDKSASA